MVESKLVVELGESPANVERRRAVRQHEGPPVAGVAEPDHDPVSVVAVGEDEHVVSLLVKEVPVAFQRRNDEGHRRLPDLIHGRMEKLPLDEGAAAGEPRDAGRGLDVRGGSVRQVGLDGVKVGARPCRLSAFDALLEFVGFQATLEMGGTQPQQGRLSLTIGRQHRVRHSGEHPRRGNLQRVRNFSPTINAVGRSARLGCGLAVCLALLAWAPAAFAAAGEQRLKYKIGPFKLTPGQNEIDFAPILERPQVDGYITRIRPDLVYTDGKVPGVDVIHLHHGVWLNMSRQDATGPYPERFVAAGEEKTIVELPKGYGYRYKTTDRWLLNHMIHNLTPVAADVYMVYEIDFIPASSPAAKRIRPARPVWMDVMNGSGLYPVFDVKKGTGTGGRYTFHGDAPNPYRGGFKRNEWEVDRDGVLIGTAGHLHPGGLYTDLRVRRRGASIRAARCGSRPSAASRRRCRSRAPRGRGNTAHLFRSKAKYYEPAGAVSWDVSMTATRPDWRVKVKKGDVLTTSATYDTKRAAWWESMGIMLTFMVDGGRGRDPFKTRVDHPGKVTHGHLPENDNHGGRRTGLPDARKLPDGPVNPGTIDVLDFRYALGDLSLSGSSGRPPVVRAGQSLSFRNADDPERIYHSLTSCKPPCNRSTGIAYPIADGPVQFESGTLGSEVPATGRLEYKTPPGLDPGTYTYFCRIHPFMRGAFRVKK